MTAATTSGFTISATSEFNASYAAWKACDNIFSTEWAMLGSPFPTIWKIQCPTQFVIWKIEISKREFGTEFITSFYFEGSKDDITWTSLAYSAGQMSLIGAPPSVLTVLINDSTYTSYSYFRLRCLTGTGTNPGINSFQMYAYSNTTLPYVGPTGPTGPVSGGLELRGFRYYNGGAQFNKVTFNLGSPIDMRFKKVKAIITANMSSGGIQYPMLIFNNSHSYPTNTDDTREWSFVSTTLSNQPFDSAAITPLVFFHRHGTITRQDPISGTTTNTYIHIHFESSLIQNRGAGITRSMISFGEHIIITKDPNTYTLSQMSHNTFMRGSELGGGYTLTHIGIADYFSGGDTNGFIDMHLSLEISDLPPTYTVQTTQI